MSKKSKNILRVGYAFFGAVLLILGLTVGVLAKKYQANQQIKQVNIPKMDVIIKSDSNMLGTLCGRKASYLLDFIKIKSVSFATDKKDLYVRYDLGGKLPESGKLPKYEDDLLTGVIFYLDMSGHYFDSMGNKNPSGLDINIKMSFYGNDKEKNDDNRIVIDGKLVAGGPGYDYFVSRFPYRQLFYIQNGTSIVFATSGFAVSKRLSGGASRFDFENKNFSIPDTNNQEFKINLGLKK